MCNGITTGRWGSLGVTLEAAACHTDKSESAREELVAVGGTEYKLHPNLHPPESHLDLWECIQGMAVVHSYDLEE